MSILVLNLFLCVFLALLVSGLKVDYPTRRKIFYILVFIPIFSLRTFVEPSSLPDLPEYENMLDLSKFAGYIEILKGEYFIICEIGYFLLCKLCSSISGNFHFFLSVVSVVWICAYFNLFRKYSPYFAASVLLLLVTEFPQSLFVLRQHLAMAIWLVAYPSVIRRDLKTFLLIGILATSMHTTGLFFFPVYFLYSMMKPKLFLLTVILLSVCIVLGFGALSLINGMWELGYDSYVSGGRKEGESNLTAFTMRLLYFLAYCYFCRSSIFEPGIYRLITTISVLGILLALFGTSFSLTGRIIRYFTPAVMLMVPVVMAHIRQRAVRYLFFASILFLNACSIFLGSMSEYIKDFKLI